MKASCRRWLSPAADAEVELKAVVATVADVPGAGNKFPVRVDLKSDDEPDWLMPGMTCKTRITVYDVKEAIVIPAELLQTDNEDPKQKYVMLQVEGEKQPVRRDVKVGKTKEKEVEIVKGMRGGRRHRQRGEGREEGRRQREEVKLLCGNDKREFLGCHWRVASEKCRASTHFSTGDTPVAPKNLVIL